MIQIFLEFDDDDSSHLTIKKTEDNWFINDYEINLDTSFTDSELKTMKEISELNDVHIDKVKFFHILKNNIRDLDFNLYEFLYSNNFTTAVFEIIVGLIEEEDDIVRENDIFKFDSYSISLNDNTLIICEDENLEEFMDELFER